MKIWQCSLLVVVACVGALGFALYSQYVDGFHPCELCIWQRYGFAVAAVFALISLVFKPRFFLSLAGAALLANAAIATYHFGIEQKLWEGFQSCSSSSTGGTLAELKAEIMASPAVRCDEATWFFLGLSMAGWNIAYSAGLSVTTFFYARKK